MIIKGGVVTFIVKVATENVNNRLNLRDAICGAVSGEDISATGFVIQEDQSDVTPSYSFDLGLSHGNKINNIPSNPDAKLITAVGDRSLLENNTIVNVAPCGYFVVNSGVVTVRCRNFLSVPGYGDEATEGFLALELDSVEDTTVRTCIPDTPLYQQDNPDGFFLGISNIERFVVLEGDQIPSINQAFIDDNFEYSWPSDIYNGLQPVGFDASDYHESVTDPASRINSQIERVFGALEISEGASLYQSTRQRAESTGGSDSFNLFLSSGLSVVDGDSGPGGGGQILSFLGTDFDNPYQAGSISRVAFRLGSLERGLGGVPSSNVYANKERTLPFFSSTGTVLEAQYLSTEGDESPVETVSSASFLSVDADNGGVSRSFKSSANHDFGVVYYDQRGRSSNVNPIGSVYVAGYSAAERGSNVQGSASVRVQLQEEAPDWAFHYQIVYGGNSSVDRFVQYTTGGAFVPVDSNDEQNIFVSLNYLQNNDDVSYVDSFGARSPEGNNRIYEFREGDKLRVISYYNENDGRVFPTNYVFDVVGLRDLGDEPDGNPLYQDGEASDVPQAKQGDFLVLRNNPTASGFRYADVQAASDSPFETFTHYWGNRCVVEIFSPSLSQGEEERVFYEVSEAYPTVINDEGVVVHSNTDITLTNGDVWWRRMAVNMPEPKADGSGYVNLIGGSTGEGFTAPSFRAYHLESSTFSDLVRNADVYSYGKVKAILPNSREVRRRSSVTFGEGNNYASKLVRFTSFNPSLFPFKDLPNRYGAVNYLEAFNEFLLIIQEDKLSRLPVSRQILSDVAGGQQLIASDVILGTQAFYSGDYGCDNNPESVVVVDNDIYFANKSVAEVYRFNRNEGGVRVISDNGMEEFFERLFRDAGVDARIVGGYDPLHGEFLISIFQPEELPAATPSFVTQPR